MTCEKPSRIHEFNCNDTMMIDDAVCGHEARLPGAGGRPAARERGGVGEMVVVTIVIAVLLVIALVYIVALLRSHADILRRLAALEEHSAGRASAPLPVDTGPASVAARWSPPRRSPGRPRTGTR